MYFRHHVFFCCNRRETGEPCCGRFNAQKMRDYAKQRVKALGLNGEGGVRINSAGCLGRCDKGPAVVVYPQGIWYTWIDEQDIDDIIEQHLQQGQVVERLLIR